MEEHNIRVWAMAELNRLEIVMLKASTAQYPEQGDELLAQFRAATCVRQCNKDGNFFTNLAIVAEKLAQLDAKRL